ncbi:MAG: hypothetical protein HWQ38_21010 [Nostoc sp. NMS7]|uniref:hypothetical protein n=1 Tax=Nostoc sp. NMS7 TaxID=2815391 RepID=UPI0025D38CA5|nr:hypothetical protein [Nostoc sp. NMS7]MBN3948801.1 hypothetical protein [Nostoc sp. NMS7]
MGKKAIAPSGKLRDRPILIGQFVVLSAQHSHSRIGVALYFLSPSQWPELATAAYLLIGR